MVLGGTSAVAPLYAGLIALLNQANGTSLGFVNQHLYANPMFFREIIKGNNITARPNLGYTARPGWNACTGLGVMENFMAPL
jgi:kumamolisin